MINFTISHSKAFEPSNTRPDEHHPAVVDAKYAGPDAQSYDNLRSSTLFRRIKGDMDPTIGANLGNSGHITGVCGLKPLR